ncbi:MAG: hypothetical protein UT61_C0068G0005 [Candidatus Woesebacteria bacterium GW2011_GWA1_39_8]|jgi:transcriptional regulator NrdR family protein|uniref:ATP-cone domain-containing protein n=1 Tax=Candidatus Woesebacteria bacterium GW2011_GWA1_39_8 TaxID=1618552 RepID=A0A0G0SQ42_9BACT|nr:MAG: hypothetical protein UT61_C0068G0005 [Candidatus Woesebacteria bacterium GW2011_GWA1_39_8]
MADIVVIKREGTTENFSLDKIIASVAKAGATLEAAEQIGTEVESWVTSAAVDGKIRSGDIRAKIVEEIMKVDPLAASTYDAYVK